MSGGHKDSTVLLLAALKGMMPALHHPPVMTKGARRAGAGAIVAAERKGLLPPPEHTVVLTKAHRRAHTSMRIRGGGG